MSVLAVNLSCKEAKLSLALVSMKKRSLVTLILSFINEFAISIGMFLFYMIKHHVSNIYSKDLYKKAQMYCHIKKKSTTRISQVSF